MLKDADVIATIAVKDLAAAKRFYVETLGLTSEPSPQQDEVLTLRSGNAKVLVYKSQYAGTNQATAATWPVDDVDGIVASLAAKGVKFEHYDMPGGTREGDVHVFGPHRAAWCKDPDGNILAIVSR